MGAPALQRGQLKSDMGVHRWQREAECLLAAAVVTGVVFATGTLDIAAARLFFRPDAADHWPLAREFPWLLLYRAASWITASLLVTGLAAFALTLTASRRHWRGAAMLLLLTIVIGPGLIGNAVLKDHWQHPRPRDVLELGGSMHYVPSPLIGGEGGASFPCGHCTVGFLYGLGWWVWKRRHPRWAVASLAAGLAAGTLLGAGRMAAGAHFLSDVIWSALLAYGVTHILYYYLLRLDEAEEGVGEVRFTQQRPQWSRVLRIAAPLAAALVLLALYALPHGSDLTTTVPLSSGTPRVLEVEADRANITIVLTDAPASELAIEGELHGFGIPSARLGAHLDTVPGPAPALRYRIEERGWLTDVDGSATLRVPASAFERIRVQVGIGNISVVDATRAGVVRAGTVELQLGTGRGKVQRAQQMRMSVSPSLRLHIC
jgi:lipid A 4'-phosphatase